MKDALPPVAVPPTVVQLEQRGQSRVDVFGFDATIVGATRLLRAPEDGADLGPHPGLERSDVLVPRGRQREPGAGDGICLPEPAPIPNLSLERRQVRRGG